MSPSKSDIGNSLDTEQALAESEFRYRMLAETSNDLIAEIDSHARFAFVNPSFRHLLGYQPEELLGHSALARVHPENREKTEELFRETVSSLGSANGRLRFAHRNGSYRWLHITVRAYRAAAGQVRAVLIARDLSDLRSANETRRRSEHRLQQSQKMEAFGRLAGGVAHDFNNLLTAIIGYSDLLLDQLDDNHPVKSDAEQILRAADRASGLTRQLLSFCRQQVPRPRALDLNSLVVDVDRMLRRLIGEDIELITMLEGELWPVKADPGQLEQVIVNLVVNGRDAISRGGRITLETRNVSTPENATTKPADMPDGRYVALAVSDTGMGIEPDVLSRAFEPFFTTKTDEQGTGLGLSTVLGIVSQCGGYVDASSDRGNGSCFTIFLPRSDLLPGSPIEAQPPQVLAGTETILLVEDADSVRQLLKRNLTRSGYTVLEAASAVDALRLSSRHPGPIDLVLCDVVLPKMSGKEIARRISHQRPETPILYMSGFTDEALRRHGIDSEENHLIRKPFSPQALRRILRDLLDQSTSSAKVELPSQNNSRPAAASDETLSFDPKVFGIERPFPVER